MTDTEAPAPQQTEKKHHHKTDCSGGSDATTVDNNHPDSSAKACFRFLSGPIKHLSFDCPENLRKALKSTAKAQGQSVCSVLQTLALAYIIASQACFSNTFKPAVTIEKLVLQRVVQRHRRVYHDREYADVVQEAVQLGEPGVCHECSSRSYVSPRITIGNQRVFLCRSCARSWIRKGFIEVLKG